MSKRSGKPESDYRRIHRINKAVLDRNYAELCLIGREKGGFLKNSIRRRCWPVLLNADQTDTKNDSLIKSKSEVFFRDKEQVDVDVRRSFVSLTKQTLEYDRQDFRNISIADCKDELSRTISTVFEAYPSLYYYQGFHDICSVLILVLGDNMAQRCAEKISLFYLRDFMMESLVPALNYLGIVQFIVCHLDPELGQKLKQEADLPLYCLSWIITWLSHDLGTSFEVVTRLFDFFISSNPLMPAYFAATILILRSKSIKSWDNSTDPIHSRLKKVPEPLKAINQSIFEKMTDMDVIEYVIQDCLKIYDKCPPKVAQKLSNINLGSLSPVNIFHQRYLTRDWQQLTEDAKAEQKYLSQTKNNKFKLASIINYSDQKLLFLRYSMVALSAIIMYGLLSVTKRDLGL